MTYRKWITNLALFIGFSFGLHALLDIVSLDSYLSVIFWAGVVCVVVIPVFFAVASLNDPASYRYAIGFIRAKITSFFRR